ncbi:MAG: hypothetical protein LBR13_07660 [Dysgonamonadaceae bacterium]|jgi:membrane-bound ClpP family serine protease|nr:hypothetical protein [Dysgonamonadaceae bacterium]
MDIAIVIVLCLIGIALILVEIFLIPGFTITGIGGAGFSIAGIWYAFVKLGAVSGIITLAATVLVVGIAFIYLVKSKTLDRISLQTNIDSKVAPDMPLDIKTGDIGVSISRLNPMGKVRVNNITMEAKTLGDFVDENSEVEVLKVSANQLIVKIK